MMNKLKLLFLASWSPAEKGLLLTDVLLVGLLLGWLSSPLKGRDARYRYYLKNLAAGYREDEDEEDEK